MNREILVLVEALAHEKNVAKEVVFGALEMALASATKKRYEEELERIRERFTPLVKICKEYGTAMRIGTNHGSLSDRILSRYGDTPLGMVESAMEFFRLPTNRVVELGSQVEI